MADSAAAAASGAYSCEWRCALDSLETADGTGCGAVCAALVSECCYEYWAY